MLYVIQQETNASPAIRNDVNISKCSFFGNWIVDFLNSSMHLD